MSVSLAPAELAARICERLVADGDPEFAAGQQRYFQHEVKAYGVNTVKLHAIERDFWRAVKPLPLAQRNSLMEHLWRDRHLESGSLVCHLYRRFARQCGRCEFKLFESWIDKHVRNWAHCDGVSSWLLSASIVNEPDLRFELRSWTGSANRWKRRASAVALLREANTGRHTDYLFEIAEVLLPDRDDMVEKGVGWLLKETYPARPRETVAFLQQRGAAASRLTLRYAAEKMTPADRKLVLA